MGYEGRIVGSPIYCEVQTVVARYKQYALSATIRTFTTSQGRPISAQWVGNNVQVLTDKGRTFLVINNSTFREL